MLEVFNMRRQEVVEKLIERLGRGNTDFEACLNANAVLQELSETEGMIGVLISNMQKLINNACDLKNVN